MNRSTVTLTWGNIMAICTAFVFPAIGIIITVVIFGTRVVDKVENLTHRVDVISDRQDRTDEKINRINGKVDTIERRQAIYQATHP